MSTLIKSFQSPHPIALAVVASGIATLASYGVPAAHGGEAVGLVFLAATYWGCLRPNHGRAPKHYGLSLGGLMEPVPLSLTRLVREALGAVAVASCVACLILPPFWLGYFAWYAPSDAFDWSRALDLDSNWPGANVLNLALAHLLVVALPEEAFFRGYLQTSLDDRYHNYITMMGMRLSVGLFISSALFALGHVTTTPQIGRLAVFFPSLLFGVLRNRTGGIGASMVLHAQCNVFAAVLGQGYGLY